MDGGVINQQAYHHLDALQWICGPVDKVSASSTNALNELEAEDTMVAALRFRNGGLGVIECTTAARPKDLEASISIIGEQGSAVVGGIALNRIDKWLFADEKEEAARVKEIYSRDVPTGYGLSHGPLIRETLNRLSKGIKEPPISGDDAEPALQLVHSLYRSVERNEWTKVSNGVVSSRLGRSGANT